MENQPPCLRILESHPEMIQQVRSFCSSHVNNVEKNASHKALKAQKESKTQTRAITELQHYYSRLPVTRTSR